MTGQKQYGGSGFVLFLEAGYRRQTETNGTITRSGMLRHHVI